MSAEQFANNAQTALNAGANNSQTTLTVASNAGFSGAPFRILVDNELMEVTGGASGTTWTVARGQETTTASAHSAGATVTQVLTAAAMAEFAQTAASNSFTGTQTIATGAAGSKGLIIQAAASQTANLQEWQDSSGNAKLSVLPNQILDARGSGRCGFDAGGQRPGCGGASGTESCCIGNYTNGQAYQSVAIGNGASTTAGTGWAISIGFQAGWYTGSTAKTGIAGILLGNNIYNIGYKGAVIIGNNLSNNAPYEYLFGWGLGTGDYSSTPSFLFAGVDTTSTANVFGIATSWVSSTHGSQTARAVFNIYDTVVREALRIEASGSAAMIGFLGASAVVRPGSTTDLRQALIDLGLYTTGGATPLSLNGGAFTAGSITNSGLTSGRLVVSSTGGLQSDSANLSYTSGTGLLLGDNLKLSTAGNGLYVKEGANATMGTVVLSSGSATVGTSKVTANSRIFLTNQDGVGPVGSVYVSARTAGTGFTITSTNGSDASTIAWMIIEPA